jgi:hypothetical protein
MRRYRIIAQIYLMLSILNLVLAAPVVVQRIHEARGDDDSNTGTKEDVAAMPNESGELPVEAASDRPTSPPSGSSSNTQEVAAMPNESGKLLVDAASDRPTSPPSGSPSNAQDVASPQHSPSLDGAASSGYPAPSSPNALAEASLQHSPSLDAAASSGYPTPHLSPASSVSGYSWLLERPPRLSPDRPGSQYASASSGSLSSQHVPAPEGPQPPPTEGPQPPPTEDSRFFSGTKARIIVDVTLVGLVIGGLAGLTVLGRHNVTGS